MVRLVAEDTLTSPLRDLLADYISFCQSLKRILLFDCLGPAAEAAKSESSLDDPGITAMAFGRRRD